jgi:hypothetical protein
MSDTPETQCGTTHHCACHQKGWQNKWQCAVEMAAQAEAKLDALMWALPADPRYARFGEAMWKYITDQGGDFCGNEISEDILLLAQAAELCCRVKYDPAIHGEGIEADPGCEIWYWGNAPAMASADEKTPPKETTL